LTQNVPKSRQNLKTPQKTSANPIKPIDIASRMADGGLRYVPGTRINTGDFAPTVDSARGQSSAYRQ
jgi:hypothetical protein